MKKLILAAAVASTFLAPQAFAQSKNFEGFSLGLSANFNNGKTEFPGQAPSDNSTTAGIRARYGWAFGGNFTLGLGASYDPGEIKTGTASGVIGVGKGLTVVSIEPGYKISPNMLVYARLGYSTIKGESSGALVASENYSGTAAGLGWRSMLNKNWSADLEVQQMTFTAKYGVAAGGDVKPSATVVSLGINYHF
jgi:opacity protein-like surface antigen